MRYQKWTKLKKQLEDFLCDSLKGRVAYHVTNYRKAHDQMGRAFITVDKIEVFNMCSIKSSMAQYKEETELRKGSSILYDVYNSAQNRSIWEQSYENIKSKGIFAQYDFYEAAEEFLASPIEHSLKSDNMILRTFAVLDRRVGKRRLADMKELMVHEHETLQFFYQLRCSAEGLQENKKGPFF